MKRTIRKAAGLLFAILLGSVPAFAAEPIEVGARAAIVMEAESGRILFEQNSRERLAMASTTKIMTAMLTLEQKNLDEVFTVDGEAIRVEGSSMGLREGDKATLRALAYGMLLPSGNDAANAAAVRIAGSQEAFAEMMNARAKELGLGDTAFVTPSGLDAPGHYTTAYDLVHLAREAMKHPEFAAICKKPREKVSFGAPPQERWLKNHNKLLERYEGCLGVKTGFTYDAGNCLVSAARKNGVTLFCVTMNSKDQWNIHASLYDRAFALLERRSLREKLPERMEAPITGGESNTVRVRPAWEPKAALSQQEYDRVQAVVLLPKMEFAPIEKDRTMGKVLFCLDGESIEAVPLVADRGVAAVGKESFWERVKGWMGW